MDTLKFIFCTVGAVYGKSCCANHTSFEKLPYVLWFELAELSPSHVSTLSSGARSEVSLMKIFLGFRILI